MVFRKLKDRLGLEEARRVYEAAIASAAIFGGFVDFSRWVLRVERIRWVGGFGRMDSVGPESFAAAEADPVAPNAPGAIAHLNADHADSLLLIAQSLSGRTDAEAATCVGVDRYGLDLDLGTPRGRTGAASASRSRWGSPMACVRRRSRW